MGNKTAIEWTDATWNPVTGCTKVSQGCKHCYAERVFPRAYGKERQFTDVRCHPERLDQPLRWKKPRRIFVNSMSDLFHEAVSDGFIRGVIQIALLAIQKQGHIFQILTKRPERMYQYFQTEAKTVFQGYLAHEPHIQWGVSVENQKTADERIPVLLQTPVRMRFVSYEPALGPVDFTPWLPYATCDACGGRFSHKADRCPSCGGQYKIARKSVLDWIIVGGESGPHARPSHPDWFRSVRNQCQAAGVPFFFKQWGEWVPVPSVQKAGDRIMVELYEDRITMNAVMRKVGKRAGGRLLDGREWSEFPEVRP